MTVTADASATPELGPLPEWDLGDLYKGPDAPELEADLKEAAAAATAFETAYKGGLAALSGDALGAAIAEYERIDEILSAVMSYAQLCFAARVDDPATAAFYQTMQERVTDISSHLLFFTLELNGLDESEMAAKLDSPAVARYGAWLRDLRVFRDHQLSDDLERLLHEKSVVGRNAWSRLFDETMAGLRFPLDGRKLTEAEILNLFVSPDRDLRQKAGQCFGKVLGDNARLFALITNILAKDKEIEDRWRRYPRPDAARHLSNHVEDSVVEALHGAVTGAYPRLSHRYYRIKADWMGLEKLEYWDRNAPLPKADQRPIDWPAARETVLAAYRRFSPEMADLGQQFFDRPWIDAPARAGKDSGAFSHPTVGRAHPYILMNYQGKPRDVMTLAHELGHGVHQILAAQQGHLQSDTPLTLAETASVFGEMLTFRAMLEKESDPARRRVMLAQKVEDMLNTVVRQIAFYEFELRVHNRRREGELGADALCDIWMAVQAESLGPAFHFADEYRHYWAYIPHFIHSPFYVYAYAFGDCLVNSLYKVYQEAGDGFAARYLDMLRAGGTLHHQELLAPFGLDASNPAFWQKGLAVIEGFIDELEQLS